MNRIHPFCASVLVLFGAACHQRKPPTAKAAPPAKVITEDSLSSIVLTAQAEQRLGIVTTPVELRKVSRSRTVGGDLLLPLGRPGETNAAYSNSIHSLLPSMTPTEWVRVAELQIEADGKVAAAEIDLTAAKVSAGRAENLVANKAGPQRAADDARAQLQLAQASLQTARERRALLGAPLFDSLKGDLLWVRVPVYAGDLDDLDKSAPARVTMLGSSTNKLSRFARPVDVPFSPAGSPATFDLFYELDNKDGSLRPGQKVSVSVAMQGEAESLVVPRAAVIYDIHGGEWVYENTGAQTFARRRIEVRFANETHVILVRGPKVGTKVVTAGAAELFGAEFGIGK